MNLQTLQWDDEILSQLNIPSAMLPVISASNHNFGSVDTSFTPAQQSDKSVERYEQIQHYCAFEGVSITGVLGDQQAALFGQTCFHRGEAKCTYGTGAFLLMNTGGKIVHSSRGLLTTVAYKLEKDSDAVFALEGSVAYCGSLIQWLRDNLGVLTSVRESEEVARSVADNGGVYFVPAFSGLYAPYWRQDARGIIAGLTAFNTRAHIVRAALEAAAFQTTEVVHAMQLDAEPHDLPRIAAMRVDGGGTSNKTLMQFQSDLLDSALLAPRNPETTAMGAAFMAGLGAGVWKDLRELKGLWHEGGSWRPAMEQSHRAKLVSV
jgi:glycerol kinase